jgi:putative transposase
MTDHFHLLLTPSEGGGIGRLFQHVGRYYVPYFNRRYRRTGTLWEGRYKATVIDPDSYLLTCYRYIELNPVRADMVKHPRDYPASSYRANAQGRADGIVAPHPVYDALGPDAAARQAAFRQLFRRRIGAATLDDIRAATNKGWVLGTERFRKAVEEALDRPTAPRPKGGDRRSEAYRTLIN